MSTEQNNEPGFFEALLTFGGAISGAVFGYEASEGIGLIIGALVFGIIGKAVGKMTDRIVKVLVLIIFILINAAVRRFLWEIALALFSQ